jgi:hypothetical protein
MSLGVRWMLMTFDAELFGLELNVCDDELGISGEGGEKEDKMNRKD